MSGMLYKRKSSRAVVHLCFIDFHLLDDRVWYVISALLMFAWRRIMN